MNCLNVLWCCCAVWFFPGLETGASALGGVAICQDKTPTDRELVVQLADPGSRYTAIRNVGRRLAESPDVFFDSVAACCRDADPGVRAEAVRLMGNWMIWSGCS